MLQRDSVPPAPGISKNKMGGDDMDKLVLGWLLGVPVLMLIVLQYLM
ncbi:MULTISPECIES: hypothetical protein [Herbaspirillum]|nr:MULTISPECIES: hypothetical protein [Herbaspirillum]MDR6396506.1 hypothetical protein [Herbaspirillum seropedicae]UMU20757.1 hypothetical protein G5B88_06030 [Herbaspirillum seropedicae]